MGNLALFLKQNQTAVYWSALACSPNAYTQYDKRVYGSMPVSVQDSSVPLSEFQALGGLNSSILPFGHHYQGPEGDW